MRRAAGPLARAASRSLAQPVNQTVRLFNRRALQPWSEFPVMEDFMRDVDRQFQRMERQMDAMFRDFGFGQLPMLASRRLRPAVESELVSEGNPSVYSLKLYLGENVDPEKIKLTFKDKLLTVEAKSEHQSEDGNTRVYQEVMRKVTLPDNVDPKDVKSRLNPDGSLLIEATLPAIEAPQPKEIPIETQQATS